MKYGAKIYIIFVAAFSLTICATIFAAVRFSKQSSTRRQYNVANLLRILNDSNANEISAAEIAALDTMSELKVVHGCYRISDYAAHSKAHGLIAVSALAKIGDIKARNELSNISYTIEPEVSKAAILALAELKDVRALERISQWIANGSEYDASLFYAIGHMPVDISDDVRSSIATTITEGGRDNISVWAAYAGIQHNIASIEAMRILRDNVIDTAIVDEDAIRAIVMSYSRWDAGSKQKLWSDLEKGHRNIRRTGKTDRTPFEAVISAACSSDIPSRMSQMLYDIVVSFHDDDQLRRHALESLKYIDPVRYDDACNQLEERASQKGAERGSFISRKGASPIK